MTATASAIKSTQKATFHRSPYAEDEHGEDEK